MPTVTIPDVVAGDPLVASTVYGLFDSAATPAASLSVINGLLAYDNIPTATAVIAAEHTQRGSAVRGFSAAGTSNLDWRWTWFGDYTSSAYNSYTVASTDPYRHIPGANRTFYVPWANADVLIFPQIFFNNDHYQSVQANPIRSDVFLMIDGTYEAAQRRSVVFAGATAATPSGYKCHRAWCGHAYKSLSRGWHTVGLALLMEGDSDIRNTRTHSASIAVLLSKQSQGV